MTSLIASLLPYAVLFSHLLFVFLLLSIIFRNSWGKDVFNFLGKRSIAIGFAISLVAVSGSLFYSNIVGFTPCDLCWWQRIFLYPTVLLFFVALRRNYKNVFSYVLPLVLIALGIALYHTYVQLGGVSVLPCTAVGGACAKVFVREFGYITIPTMSLTVSLYFLLIMWSHKLYEKENSNA